MKKLLVILLALSLIFAFAACNQQEAPVEEEPAAEEAAPAYVVGVLNVNGFTEEEVNALYDGMVTQQGAPDADIIFYDDFNSMLLALGKGDIDLFRTLLPSANYIAAAVPDAYAVQETDTISDLSMAVAADNTALLETLNSAIEALEADGTLAALKEQYIGNCDPANMPAPVEIPVIEGGETVRVVVTGDIPPMDYMTVDGKAAGYNIALLSAIANQAQINIEMVSANSASRMLMITGGKADAVFWNRSHTAEDNTVIGEMNDALAATRPYLSVPSALVALNPAGTDAEAPAE